MANKSPKYDSGTAALVHDCNRNSSSCVTFLKDYLLVQNQELLHILDLNQRASSQFSSKHLPIPKRFLFQVFWLSFYQDFLASYREPEIELLPCTDSDPVSSASRSERRR